MNSTPVDSSANSIAQIAKQQHAGYLSAVRFDPVTGQQDCRSPRARRPFAAGGICDGEKWTPVVGGPVVKLRRNLGISSLQRDKVIDRPTCRSTRNRGQEFKPIDS